MDHRLHRSRQPSGQEGVRFRQPQSRTRQADGPGRPRTVRLPGGAGKPLLDRLTLPKTNQPTTQSAKYMTKAQEIEIIREAIARLGSGSYCGPWLAGQLGAIESALSSDYPPGAYALNPAEATLRAAEIIQSAKEDAANIRQNAEKDAAAVRDKAINFCADTRNAVRRDLESALARITRY